MSSLLECRARVGENTVASIHTYHREHGRGKIVSLRSHDLAQNPASPSAAPAMTMMVLVDGESPEETCARRLNKRVEGLSSLQRRPAFILAVLHGVELPAAPDPYDLSISKRTWETEMQRWRAALRALLHDIHTLAEQTPLSVYDE